MLKHVRLSRIWLWSRVSREFLVVPINMVDLADCSAGESFDHRFHHGGSNTISDHLDLVATSTTMKPKCGWKAHCASEFVNLQHAKHWFSPVPCDVSEPIKSSKRSERAIKTLPSPGTIRPVIHDQKWHSFAERIDGTFGTLQCWSRSVFSVQRPRRPRSVQSDYIFSASPFALP